MIKELWIENKKKIVITGCTILVCVVIVAGMLYFYAVQKKVIEGAEGVSSNSANEMNRSSGFVSASGTTIIGMLEETFDVDSLEEDLYIEKVYVTTGDEIAAGDKILQFSKESIDTARQQLEKEKTEADLDYRQGVIDNKQGKIDGQEEYDLSIQAGSVAQQVYDETIAKLDEQVTALETELAENQKTLKEYQEAIASDSYYTEYGIDQKLTTYNENNSILKIKMSEWGIAESQITSTLASTQGGSNSQVSDDLKWKIAALTALKSEVDENEKEYEKALEDYENAKEEATIQIKKRTAQLESQTLNLEKETLSVEAEKVTAQSVYETAVAESNAAKTTFDTEVKKLDETLEALLTAKEDADDQLQLFEDTVGDTYFHASNSGTIVMVGCSEDTTLSADAMIIAYNNPDTVSVTVAVDQSDIALLEVSEQANVTISGYGNYSGRITEIVPIASSDSKSSVTYDVTVMLDGDISGLESNLTAQVVFGMEE